MFGFNFDPRWTKIAVVVGSLLALALASGVDYRW